MKKVRTSFKQMDEWLCKRMINKLLPEMVKRRIVSATEAKQLIKLLTSK
jgi:hypothetical protein